MARGIIIFGGAGSGKTTLGRAVAQALGFPYYDIDDFLWRKDTQKPFTVMCTRQEKIDRLMKAISASPHFVMAGSMDSFHEAFDPFFDLGVHLICPKEIRLERILKREQARYGDRIAPGGDIAEIHRRFMIAASAYEDNTGSPSFAFHDHWRHQMPCETMVLSGDAPLDQLCDEVVKRYREAAQRNPSQL